jgi:hypothetical protein
MSVFRFLAVLLAAVAFEARASSPKVTITSPDNGEVDVSPEVKEIRIVFDQPMHPRGRSVIGGGESFPKFAADPRWADNKTFIIPVALESNHQYNLSINSDTFKGFSNPAGESAEWYPIQFKTRGAGAAPAEPDVTPGQNQAAFKALVDAINNNYAYRDRKKIIWDKEIARRKEKFEQARSANEFARVTAHLLRLAEDAHVSVEAGDIRIGTRANSASPNSNYPLLQQKVPAWKEWPSGIVTGQFEDGIGYVLFSDCSKQQAEGFDEALSALKDTRALILDVRMNGGGDEVAAGRVAGRFIEKPAVYSRDRIREAGKWNGPFDRTVAPRKDAERYAKPVAVLIGPKVGSSAESFVAMMKYGAKAKLIGEPTKGSSGRPMPHPLGNGVTVYLSSWEDQTPDGQMIEGRGIRPDIVIKAKPADLQQRDPVLDTALMFHRSAAGASPARQ